MAESYHLPNTRWTPKKESAETKKLYKSQMAKIEHMVCEVNGLPFRDRARGFTWVESIEKLREDFPFLKDTKIDPQNPTVIQLAFNSDDGVTRVTLIYLPQNHRIKLAESTDKSKLGNDLPVYVDAIEEVSHFVYSEYYHSRYQKKVCSAMLELVAVLDKYNLVEALHQKVYGETLDVDDINYLLSINASANKESNLGVTEGMYVIGHRMGVFFLSLLNKTYEQVFSQTRDQEQAALKAGELMAKFYKLDNRSQLIFLLNQGFPIETYSPKEEEAVREILVELGISERDLIKV